MNERIKELDLKAAYGIIDPNGAFTVEEFIKFKEKFAELIIQECAGIAKHNVMNISTYADAEFVEDQIKEYFGVE